MKMPAKNGFTRCPDSIVHLEPVLDALPLPGGKNTVANLTLAELTRALLAAGIPDQTMQTLWVKHSDEETIDRQLAATTAALIGVGPKGELEGMMAAQLIAAHNAAMECYRRAMLGEQTFEGRRENLKPPLL